MPCVVQCYMVLRFLIEKLITVAFSQIEFAFFHIFFLNVVTSYLLSVRKEGHVLLYDIVKYVCPIEMAKLKCSKFEI